MYFYVLFTLTPIFIHIIMLYFGIQIHCTENSMLRAQYELPGLIIRDVIDQNSVINCLFARQNFQKMRRYSYCIDVMKYYVLWLLIILI